MVQVTASAMAEPSRVRRIALPLERGGVFSRLSLTARILAVNILPLLLLGGGIVYLDSYRAQLLDERYKLARIEAQITAEALAGATRQRQDALLLQIGKEQDMRLRLFDAQGKLVADSFQLGEPTFTLDDPSDDPFELRFARFLDQIVDTVVSAQPVPRYIEPESNEADAWPELQRARELGISQIELRQAADRTPVITAAAPVGLQGELTMMALVLDVMAPTSASASTTNPSVERVDTITGLAPTSFTCSGIVGQ